MQILLDRILSVVKILMSIPDVFRAACVERKYANHNGRLVRI